MKGNRFDFLPSSSSSSSSRHKKSTTHEEEKVALVSLQCWKLWRREAQHADITLGRKEVIVS